jgi:phage shock protein C
MNCPNCQREIAEQSNFCYYCGARQQMTPAGTHTAHKRLMRSATDSKIAGVCGGIAEYLEIDSTVVRLIWVIAVFLPVPIFPAIVGYIVGWIIMPLAPAAAPSATPQAQPTSTPHPAQTV